MVRDVILDALTDASGDSRNMIKLEFPGNPLNGDYSSNIAMQLSGGGNPRDTASQLVAKLNANSNLSSIVEKIEVAGPGFINFYIKNDVLIDNLIQIVEEKETYGDSEVGNGKTVVVDYSAPNIAKPFGIGHLKSTIIGQALYNLYKKLGYKVIGDNHLGDWGTQFGKLLYMIDKTQTTDLSVQNLEKLYVEFHQHPEWEEEGRKWFKKLEEGDSKAREVWKKCIDTSLSEFERIYKLMHIKIDYAYGESFYESMILGVIEDAKKAGVAYESEGALIIDIPGSEVPLMLLKSDGATTYATRDLATLKFRKKEWNPDIVIYEVGVEQKLHFQQVFAAARMLGYVSEDSILYHTNHGWYLGEDGKKFSTRRGRTIKLEEIFNEAIEKAKTLGSDEESAVDVGVGAIKYFDLSHNVQSDIVFDWDKIMALEGNSGPYLQYTYARAKSVLEKTGKRSDVLGKLTDFANEELILMRALLRFPEIVEDAANGYSPNMICNYLFDLASKFNAFYNKHRIVGGDDVSKQDFRLLLTDASAQIIKNGLTLLGIEAPERM